MVKSILYKDIFIIPIVCGVLVQILKSIIYSVAEREANIGRLFQADGMPNLHATVFAALSTTVGLKYGFSSILFAVTATYTFIIVHDTMKVKREKEKQVGILNSIISNIQGLKNDGLSDATRILQFRPLDVSSGAAFGILLAYLIL
ncbi:MAG: divergent PAP2 family protein [Candidatus Krumholzibacteriota bacterium]|nr:divergent PAP2 family protein [Candidatus Krumholzibacteriota bacterium]